RDRLNARDWIAKVILGPPDDRAANKDEVMSENQQGFLFRLFAYHGGPLVLNAMVSGMTIKSVPQRAEDIAPWFDDAMGQIVRSRSAAAAQVLEVNKHSVFRLLKLALIAQRANKGSAGASPGVSEQHLAHIVKTLDRDYYKQMLPPTKPGRN